MSQATYGASVMETAIRQKYLTFNIDVEEYAIDILRVREIIGILAITKVPQTPDFVKGVINLRGKIHPVIDLRLKFGMEEAEYTQETCIIVVDIDNEGQAMQMGVLVDSVKEVVDISDSEIEAAPDFGTKVKTDFISGIGKVKSKVILLLNIERVLSSDEICLIKQLEE